MSTRSLSEAPYRQASHAERSRLLCHVRSRDPVLALGLPVCRAGNARERLSMLEARLRATGRPGVQW